MESGSDARLFHIALPRMDNGKGRARWGGAGLSVLGDRALHFFKKGSCDEAEQRTAEGCWPFPTYGDLLFGVE